ncbi:MAG: hypothetical protein ACI8TX_000040 [Hyphomicrobiaceae bacterium]
MGAEFARHLGVRELQRPEHLGLQIEPPHANTLGFVHGGVVGSLALAAAEAAAQVSERGDVGLARPLSLSIRYERALREENLEARGRVVARGRDAVHVESEVFGSNGSRAASLAAVWWMHRGEEAGVLREGVRARRSPQWYEQGVDVPSLDFSPYTHGLGARVTHYASDGAAMSLPLFGNRAADGRLHEGPMLGAIDTCAALAAKAVLDPEPFAGGATLSISMLFARPATTDLRLDARCLSAVGEAFTQDVEVTTADGEAVAAATVVYRIRRAS